MRRLFIVGISLILLIGISSAVPVNFTNWYTNGDSWKSNNDTFTLIMWNATGSHTWLSTGNASSVEYLVIAGGGAGGNSNGAGGGAGGVLYGASYSVSGLINITVGNGGVGSTSYTWGANGKNSSFANTTAGDGINAYGGGGGGYNANPGLLGGSGGGGAHPSQAGGSNVTGQGFNGGAGAASSGEYGGGGGGGASSVGATGTTSKGGNGGSGYTTYINGTGGVCYAGGGGGSIETTTAGNIGVATCGGGNGGRNGGASVSGVASTGGGGGGARSNAYSAGSGGSGIVIISYSSAAPPEPPVASFTCTPTTTTLGTPISCTDTSSDTPTNWTYYWGDGNVTDGTQNPSYTYPFTGTFSINQTVNNTLGSSWYNRSNYITITNVTSFTQQDIYLTGQYTITFNVKSSTTNLPIANVTVVDSASGQSYPSTNGTCYLTLPAGLYYINFIADGYQTKQVTYVVDQDEVHEVKMVPSAAAPTRSISNWYSPHQVRFAVVDSMGVKVVGSTINASAIATTLPTDGTADWLTAMYGIDPDAANDMMNGTLIMHGITQSDGATVFTMHSSIGYSLAVTNPSNGVTQNVNVTPIDTIYTIHLLGTAANNTYMDMGYNTSLYVTEPDVNNVTMNLAYQDMSARTTLLEFFVLARVNNTVINYQSTSSIGSNVILMNYTVQNVRPDRYSWYYNAVRVK